MSDPRIEPESGREPRRINFFRPLGGYMRREVLLIGILLAGWAFFTFGFQLLLVLTQRDPTGEGPFTEATFLGFPFHHWFTGQFLVVWFILLCFLFNLFIDLLADRFRRRK